MFQFEFQWVALRVWPCTCKAAAAAAFVKSIHRHLPDVGGGRFAASLVDDRGRMHGVAMAGNGPQEWEGTGRLIITRVATNGVSNGCSKLYAALCKAGKSLGYLEAWTYTLPEEPGTSLRAAGFIDMGLTEGGEHDRPSRKRKAAVRPEPKRRWKRILSGTGVVA